MSDASIRRLFAYHLAQKNVLNALIATHSDPQFLVKALRHYAEPAAIALLNSTLSDECLSQYEEELKQFLTLAEKYAQT